MLRNTTIILKVRSKCAQNACELACVNFRVSKCVCPLFQNACALFSNKPCSTPTFLFHRPLSGNCPVLRSLIPSCQQTSQAFLLT